MAILYFSLPFIGIWVSLLAFVLMMPLVVVLGGLWGLFGNDNSARSSESNHDIEKRKRNNLDAVLRDLSDEDLVHLKHRLTDGMIDDDLLYDRMTLSDDGELVSADYDR